MYWLECLTLLTQVPWGKTHKKTHLKYQCGKKKYTKENIIKIYCTAQHLFLIEKSVLVILMFVMTEFWWGFPCEWEVMRRCWRRPSPRTRTSHRSNSPAAHSRLRIWNVSLKIATSLWKAVKGQCRPNLDAPALEFATADVTWNFRRLVPKVAVS